MNLSKTRLEHGVLRICLFQLAVNHNKEIALISAADQPS